MKRFSKITTTQLARICGVSQGTVDRALHDRGEISEKTKERILSVAREYDYTPSIKGGTSSNSMLIGVILFDLYNEYFSKLAMSIVESAKAFGYSVIFQFSDRDEKSERASLEYFSYIGVDGIILFSSGSDSTEYENYLRTLKTPLVFIGNRMYDFTYIGIDDRKAMYELTKQLASEAPNGDIVYFSPILKRELHKTNAQRLRAQGFIDAMTELNRGHCIATDLDGLVDFSAIVCATDYYAINVLKHFGYPKDIKIAGFDNLTALKSFDTRVLSVDYPTDRVAGECMNYILGKKFESNIPHTLVYSTDTDN